MKELRDYLGRLGDLEGIESILYFDQQTVMPKGGVEARSRQYSVLSAYKHELATSKKLGKLIESIKPSTEVDLAIVREASRDYRRATKLPSSLVKQLAEIMPISEAAWTQARSENKFQIFQSQLEKVVELMRQVAEFYGYEGHIYNALLDEYEPGVTAAEVEALFDELKAGIVSLLQRIKKCPLHSTDVLKGKFDKEAQLAYCRELMKDLGFDFNRGYQGVTTHPFCLGVGTTDVRPTTRVSESFIFESISSIIHEMGHALYEQGVSPEYDYTSIAGGVSLGLHESQSRLWENLVGRSRPFWRSHLPRLQRAFPQLNAVTIDEFYSAINSVQPSFIRVEADEVTYNIHIIVRFELEKALLDGSLKVADLPAAWNAKYQDYLGITPPNDAQGVLQDMHWSGGGIGYFPTYAIGNVLSVQIYNAAINQVDGLQTELDDGHYDRLLDWLRQNIYRHGKLYQPKDLVKGATGEPMTAKPYLKYLEDKYSKLYELDL